MRISEAGGHIEFKIPAVMNNSFPKSDVFHSILFKRLSQQQRLQDWIKLFGEIFYQDGCPELRK